MRPLHRWAALVPDGSVRALHYSFGPGTANCLAVRHAGGWLVLSPSVGSPAAVFDELARDGDVTALVAPNAYHHRGQAEWRARFPEAVGYAPTGALPRLRERSSEVDYRSIDELRARLPAAIGLVVPEGLKSPDLLLRVRCDGAVVWWLGELFSNVATGEQAWWLRIVSRLAGSGPGYRRNARPELVYVRDRAAWLASVRAAVEADPPTVVVPAHGAPVVEDAARRTAPLLRLS